MNIPIIYEDDWLLAVDKPSGLLVIPTPKNESRTLTSILNQDLEDRGVSYRLHPCHRLDRDTSGVIIYAKGKSIQQKMMDLFSQRQIKKVYIAFVQGSPVKSEGTINNPVEGKSAKTEYKVIRRLKDFSVLQVSPLTGRTNQIRIHLKQLGCPILGERIYAFRKDFVIKAKRLCLHARDLFFKHPVSGKDIHLSVDLAPELKEFLEKHSCRPCHSEPRRGEES